MGISTCFSILAAVILCTLQVSEAKPCGGSLQANQGVLEYVEESSESDGRPCVWTIRLQSKSSFALTLDGIDSSSSVGLFSSEQASSTFPIVQPVYIFDKSTIGWTTDTQGDIIILVLNPTEEGRTVQRHFTMSWDGLQDGAGLSIDAANYLDSDRGAITQSDAGVRLLAYVLNPPSGHNVNAEMKILGFEEDCADLGYTIFEINEVGNLREIARTCGRPMTLLNLRPPLIAFVAKATIGQSETISLKWDSIRPAPVDTRNMTDTANKFRSDGSVVHRGFKGTIIQQHNATTVNQ